MPRKQNGFGNVKSLAFKGGGRTDRGKISGASGSYPSVRRFGTSVTRTILEKWDLDNNWVKWRKGFEIWSKALYSLLRTEKAQDDPTYIEDPYEIARLLSILYQGTAYPTRVLFYGWEFPTRNADVNSHYVAKRIPLKVDEDGNPVDISMGYVTQIDNDPLEYPEQFQYGEIWIKGVPNARGRLLLQMVNERLTDGTTIATVKNILTNELKPAIYYGITAPNDVRAEVLEAQGIDLEPTEVELTIPLSSITENPNPQQSYRINQGLNTWDGKVSRINVNQNPEELIGKIIYVPDFFIERPADSAGVFTQYGENNEYISLGILDSSKTSQVICLDPGISLLPPSMYDITSLPQIFSAGESSYTLTGTYVFKKADYQRFYDPQYFTANLLEQATNDFVYSILPFTIKAAYIEGSNLIISSVPFNSEIQIHPELTPQATVIFDDKSFTKLVPGDTLPQSLYTDINPWQDETFIAGNSLEPAVTYACSCPSFSKSILSAPQATENNETRKINRQRRYPLPSVMSQDRFFGAGSQSVAGKASSWEQLKDKQQFKMCKHAAAAMFDDGIKVIEPNEYPTVEARKDFDSKLEKEIREYDESFRQSFERSGISLTEIVFALSQGLNLSNSETAYILFNQ